MSTKDCGKTPSGSTGADDFPAPVIPQQGTILQKNWTERETEQQVWRVFETPTTQTIIDAVAPFPSLPLSNQYSVLHEQENSAKEGGKTESSNEEDNDDWGQWQHGERVRRGLWVYEEKTSEMPIEILNMMDKTAKSSDVEAIIQQS